MHSSDELSTLRALSRRATLTGEGKHHRSPQTHSPHEAHAFTQPHCLTARLAEAFLQGERCSSITVDRSSKQIAVVTLTCQALERNSLDRSATQKAALGNTQEAVNFCFERTYCVLPFCDKQLASSAADCTASQEQRTRFSLCASGSTWTPTLNPEQTLMCLLALANERARALQHRASLVCPAVFFPLLQTKQFRSPLHFTAHCHTPQNHTRPPRREDRQQRSDGVRAVHARQAGRETTKAPSSGSDYDEAWWCDDDSS